VSRDVGAPVFSEARLATAGRVHLPSRGVVDEGTTSRAADARPAPPAARLLGRLNDLLGGIEEVAVAACLGALIGVSVFFAYASKVQHSTAIWPYEVIRYTVFFVAMAGACLAAQRQGMFNMDLVTRRFGVGARSALRILAGVLVALLCAVVVVASLDLHANALLREDHEIISEAHATLALIVGFALIGLHFLLHAAIEVAYWAAGVTPPDPPQGGHG
jgi:TRAP-type C4-dicarboxylate transport system permease small subunit